MQTFIFKPADIKDSVNPAHVSPDELRESRKAYKKTEMATHFIKFSGRIRRNDLSNIRHTACAVIKTGILPSHAHPLMKHSIRFQRNVGRR